MIGASLSPCIVSKKSSLGSPTTITTITITNIITIIIVGHTWKPFSAVSFWSSWWQLERHSLSADGKTEPLNSPV